MQHKVSFLSFKDQKAEAQTGRLPQRLPSNRSPRCQCWAHTSGGPYPCAVWGPSVTRRTEQPGRKGEGLGAAGTSGRPSWFGNPVWDLSLELDRWYLPIFSPPQRSPPPPAKDSITLAALQPWGPGQPLTASSWKGHRSRPGRGQTSCPESLWNPLHFQENCKTFEEQMVNSS